MPPNVADLWAFLLLGYVLTVLLETPVLILGLSPQHDLRRRLFCGWWLTACTYPVVVIVFPLTVWPLLGYSAYVAIAEVFAPLAECALFWWAFGRAASATWRTWLRDMATIVVANLVSFLVGGWIVDQWQVY